jgi:adenine phosphoribosyltransferase
MSAGDHSPTAAPPTDLSDGKEVAAYLKGRIQMFPIAVMTRVDFVDVASLLLEPAAFQFTVDALTHRYRNMGVTHVVSCESRGFIFGAPVALALKAAFVPVRRSRKIPGNTVGVDYVSGFYSGRLEMQADAIPAGARVVIIDDFVATVRCMIVCCGWHCGANANANA